MKIALQLDKMLCLTVDFIRVQAPTRMHSFCLLKQKKTAIKDKTDLKLIQGQNKNVT